MQRIVVDANVLLSFITSRIEKQRDTAKALLLRAAEGELSAVVPQFVVFETVYVLQSTYRIPANELAPIVRDLIALPGVLFIDDCPWKRVLDLWPSPFPSIADPLPVGGGVADRASPADANMAVMPQSSPLPRTTDTTP